MVSQSRNAAVYEKKSSGYSLLKPLASSTRTELKRSVSWHPWLISMRQKQMQHR